MGGDAELSLESSSKCFGGYQKVFSHQSEELKCTMKFSVYLPPKAESAKCPLLLFLSGSTRDHEYFALNSGFQKYASLYSLIVVVSDTSPRGCNIPGEDEKWYIGTGAGMYVDATAEPWSKHYRMYSYVTRELPSIIERNFPVLPDKTSIMGHSMGGHGALICALKNPGLHKSVSAFAPVCDSVKCRPSRAAFEKYFGSNEEIFKEWSAIELVKQYNGPPMFILIDQGTVDEFLKDIYLTEFVEACAGSHVAVQVNMRDEYDHGYFFLSTFLEDHFKHHAEFLR